MTGCVKTVQRNEAWLCSNSLLTATLRRYPLNPMSLFGKAWDVRRSNVAMAKYFASRASLATGHACVSLVEVITSVGA